MGLEFKPYFAWEEEEEQARSVHKQQQQQQQCINGSDAEKQTQPTTTTTSSAHIDDEEEIGEAERREGGELVGCLAAINSENREYAVLVAEEEEDVNEYKSCFSIVLDYPQFLGQGESKESALRQASRLLHYAFGSMLLKNEAVPLPSDGAQVEVCNAINGCTRSVALLCRCCIGKDV